MPSEDRADDADDSDELSDTRDADDTDDTDESCDTRDADESVGSSDAPVVTSVGDAGTLAADEVRLRRFESGDESAVLRVDDRAMRAVEGFDYFGPGADLRDVSGTYLAGEGTFLVAELREGAASDVIDGSLDSAALRGARGRVVVGCGGLWRWDERVVEVRRMRVHPAVQGAGVGRAVLGALEATARARGDEWIVLHTMRALERARAFYDAAGYQETWREPFAWGELVFFRKELCRDPKRFVR